MLLVSLYNGSVGRFDAFRKSGPAVVLFAAASDIDFSAAADIDAGIE